VRQALWLAIDRSQFIEKVFQGAGTPQAVLSNGLTFWALSQEEIKPYVTPDLKKAKDLLTAAGYPNGFDLTIDSSGGVQLYIDHLEVLTPQLKAIGVNVKTQLSDLPSFLSDKLFLGKFDAVVLTGNPNETPMRPLDLYHKNGVAGLNWFHYDNPKVNQLVDAQKAELDINKRQQLVKDAQRAILEDWAPLTTFVSPTLFLSYNKRVGGFDPTQRKYVYYTYSEYLKPGA
jgi:peptide/nickel transport system substrate-binding protein